MVGGQVTTNVATYGNLGIIYRPDSSQAKSQVVVQTGTGGGSAIHCDGAGHGYRTATNYAFIYRLDAGAGSALLTYNFGAAFDPSVSIERDVSDIVVKYAGVEAGRATDITYTSGHPGLGITDGPFTYLDDWTDGASGGGGTSDDVGLSEEVDASLALSGIKSVAAGRSDEVDVAQGMAGIKSASTSCTDETDTSLALAGLKSGTTGRADELDTSLAPAALKLGVAGLATEQDISLSLTGTKFGGIGRSDEVDEALAPSFSAGAPIGLAVEIEVALSPPGTKLASSGRSDEADSCLSLSGLFMGSVGCAQEGNIALDLHGLKSRIVGLSVEIDTALSLLPDIPEYEVDPIVAVRFGDIAMRSVQFHAPSQRYIRFGQPKELPS